MVQLFILIILLTITDWGGGKLKGFAFLNKFAFFVFIVNFLVLMRACHVYSEAWSASLPSFAIDSFGIKCYFFSNSSHVKEMQHVDSIPNNIIFTGFIYASSSSSSSCPPGCKQNFILQYRKKFYNKCIIVQV